MENDENCNTHTAKMTEKDNSVEYPLVLDLESIIADLKTSTEAVNGLRKKVLLKSSNTIIILLSFEKGGNLPEHCAPGTATINIVKGLIHFKVLGKTHHLSGGQVIVLEPKVMHELDAAEASTVLVTISI